MSELPPPTERLRGVVAYDGAGFHGFARNDPHPTVAGFLEEHLRRSLRAPVQLTGAGRTDRGVHARGQVVSFDAPVGRADPVRLRRSILRLSGGAVSLGRLEVAPPDFDARFSATWRRYRYRVATWPVPDPLRRHVVWWVGEELDVASMDAAAQHLLGSHDFASCCRRPPPRPDGTAASLVRRVLDAGWSDGGAGELVFEIRATSFCHQMVRSIVGMLVDVGRGRRSPAAVADVLAAGDRAGVPHLAPPSGLCLWDIGYPDGFGVDGPHLPSKIPAR